MFFLQEFMSLTFIFFSLETEREELSRKEAKKAKEKVEAVSSHVWFWDSYFL